jgi:ubiquinone/menaquinone biosynthesis C-methylase UbiE
MPTNKSADPENSNPEAPNPALIFATLNAHQNSAALRGAIELDVFTAIAEGNHTPEALAKRCKASERGLRILCDYLTVIGFLAKPAGRYELAPVSAAFLDRREPSYLGGLSRFLNSPDLMRAFTNPAELVRRGTTLLEGVGTVEPEYEGWIEFARGMAAMMGPPAEFIGGYCARHKPGAIRVLDIAAGHGLFGISVARHNPQARIVALDWPKVLEVAQENAIAANVQKRYHLLPGDALSVGYGEGFDVVLITNFFHHFDPPTCESLMQKIHASLNPGGLAVTLEFVPNEDRVSPPLAATFSFVMLGTTGSGDAYTLAEYERMFQSVGFKKVELVEIPENPQQLVISHR